MGNSYGRLLFLFEWKKLISKGERHRFLYFSILPNREGNRENNRNVISGECKSDFPLRDNIKSAKPKIQVSIRIIQLVLEFCTLSVTKGFMLFSGGPCPKSWTLSLWWPLRLPQKGEINIIAIFFGTLHSLFAMTVSSNTQHCRGREGSCSWHDCGHSKRVCWTQVTLLSIINSQMHWRLSRTTVHHLTDDEITEITKMEPRMKNTDLKGIRKWFSVSFDTTKPTTNALCKAHTTDEQPIKTCTLWIYCYSDSHVVVVVLFTNEQPADLFPWL